MTIDDAQVWHAAQEDDLDAINAIQTDLLPPTGNHAVTTSRIIPLPPFLVPFFIDQANTSLLQLCKKICSTYTANDPAAFQACTLTQQFLLAAITMDPMGPNPHDSQLAVALQVPATNNILAQWAMGRYSGYQFLTTCNPNLQPTLNTNTTATTTMTNGAANTGSGQTTMTANNPIQPPPQ